MAANTDFFVVRKGATAVPNGLVHNKKLSWASLGLIVYCLSLPTGARVGYRELQGRGLGEKATRKALIELEELSYRFRFKHRRQGRIRELTIVADTPLTPGEAYAAALELMRAGGFVDSEIISCASHPDFSVPTPRPVSELSTAPSAAGSHRAATGAARYDQPKRSPKSAKRELFAGEGGVGRKLSTVPAVSEKLPRQPQAADQQEHGVSAGRTVQCSTVARSGTAQASKDTSKDISLRSISTPFHSSNAAGPGDGVVGVEISAVHSSDQAPAGPSEQRVPNWDLIVEAVPDEQKRGLMGKAAQRVSDSLEMLIAAGWTSRQLRHRLADNPLPPKVRNMPGLLISRIDAMKIIPVPQSPASRSTNTTRDDSPQAVGPAMTKEERLKALEETAQLRAELAQKFAARRATPQRTP